MQARFWHRNADGSLTCDLCPQGCRLNEGQTGLCRVRSHSDGALQADGYARVSAIQIDPIEKKPLYHFRPGTDVLSLGMWGCNFRCRFCQNWQLSQSGPGGPRDGTTLQPKDVPAMATDSGVAAVAYTYSEPLVNIEYVHDTAVICKRMGLANIVVTNGSINPAPLATLLPHIDAMNIDIKSMDPRFYRDWCGGQLPPVLATARSAVAAGCHVEITNLLIPDANDADADIERLASWVATELGEGIPLHLSAYYPSHACELPPTPPLRVRSAVTLARGYLRHVHAGNI
jgi:pyruvate formate lyase activating enzyme